MDNLKDLAYNYIKQKILTCELMPGYRLKEKDLMDQINVGRTPVWEALLRLEQENLVKINPRSGTYVKAIEMDAVLELYQLRKIIEPSTAVIIKDKIDSMKLLDFCDTFKSAEAGIISHQLDTEFHEYIISCTGNKRLIDFFNTMMESIFRLDIYNTLQMVNNSQQTTYEEHYAIAQAIIMGDNDLIRKTYIDHINHSQFASITALRRQEHDG